MGLVPSNKIIKNCSKNTKTVISNIDLPHKTLSLSLKATFEEDSYVQSPVMADCGQR